ncbi:hypothetical protein NCCP2716_27530 [Sporosarcina sp. NCCP-2716]|uniref:hypothetical protein n=1 Tax=Sporosarcina sp. NCCP-2716 TaxID=2943679 RepID=UPI00203B85E8|nr:hypothetical protein [Sporosarcina sp. NCCP-2716]GKV70255.1 hypothetical protein NCCP2716_27530 [Sporosarcina sp. NCCP-2716]
MKITVGDVMKSKANVRDYLSVHPENGRIYANIDCVDIVLIDRTEEWDVLRAENACLREALKFYALKGCCTDAGLLDDGNRARQALKGESQ